ncbi:TPA: hypothetical protein DCE37_05215 [Candidatus Latescibacteria bacterium]|nr:hypothetical protein [Candidatus Latescibacterota bacterium]
MEEQLHLIRALCRQENHLVTAAALKAIQSLGTLAEDDLSTPEYGTPEYLVNCDTQGRPVRSSIKSQDPHDPRWYKVVDGQILVLRWLAHFLGLRHRAIHLFLDHPDHPDCTFVQIRSLAKYNQPGLFDIPVAGHVDGLDSPEETVRKELNEELGLDIDQDLVDLRVLAIFNVAIPDFQPNYAEIEHTTLYRATIEPASYSRIRLQEDELGGLILFRKDELAGWIASRGEQVGGGLADSWYYYVEDA